jgi:hypothetical protein
VKNVPFFLNKFSKMCNNKMMAMEKFALSLKSDINKLYAPALEILIFVYM